MAKRRIIIDTDPGVDDAIAIFLALASPEIDVVAITTVNGNVDVDKTTLNARRLVTMAGRADIPVARGAATPLAGPSGSASDVHGEDGLGDLSWSEPHVPEDELSAVAMLVRECLSAPTTIVAIGPLTNLAHLVLQHPEVIQHVEQVVVMGGASFEGNVTPAAEFNIWADPEAAEIALGTSWPIVLMPLDLTHQAFLSPKTQSELAAMSNNVGPTCAGMLEHYADFHEQWYQNRNVIMHDAMAVYEIIDSAAITKERVGLQVETSGKYARGATFVSRGHAHSNSNIRVGTHVDNDRFCRLLVERLTILP